jgi:hypothetical protein
MATTKNARSLGIGILLAISFAAVLVLIFMPIFGENRNGLTFADDLFNKLSKGSSYFIPKLQKSTRAAEGTAFSAEVALDKPETAALAQRLFTTAGARAEAAGEKLKVSGDLGKVLAVVLQDADDMYYNRGTAVSGRYGGAKEKDALRAWWTALSAVDKSLKKAGKVDDAKYVSEVLKKGVETAYNYYGIPPVKVAEKAGLMGFLLVFYVAYTLWWGFAIYFIFDGIGLTMKKAKVKKEV